jgi:DNA-binding CsgD family transcriptional regulator
LRQTREDEKELEENVLLNMKQLVFPSLERLKKSRLNKDQVNFVGSLESNLLDLTSPFVGKLSSKIFGLSPMEIRIASLVKDGKPNKEIAELLCLSKNTIMFHRKNIRTKFGLKKKGINLRSYLQALQE